VARWRVDCEDSPYFAPASIRSGWGFFIAARLICLWRLVPHCDDDAGIRADVWLLGYRRDYGFRLDDRWRPEMIEPSIDLLLDRAWLRSLNETFQQMLNSSGRFQLAPIPPDLENAIAAVSIANCNGCERELALKVGADLAACPPAEQ
jgi:Protein of unknown function (DUF2380)